MALDRMVDPHDRVHKPLAVRKVIFEHCNWSDHIVSRSVACCKLSAEAFLQRENVGTESGSLHYDIRGAASYSELVCQESRCLFRTARYQR